MNTIANANRARLPRIPELDFLRGLMIVIMMMDHLIYFPLLSLKPYTYNITFQTFGFVSAAEGFVLVSGILFGLVYGRKLAAEGAHRFHVLAGRRLFAIYAHYFGSYFLIALLFSLPAFAEAWPQNWESQEMIKNDPWAMLARGAIFVHQTGLLDILPMYFVFVALAIPAMHFLAKGKWRLLLAISAMLWLFGQTRPQLYIEMQTDLHLGWFELTAWQFMFVAGLALGFWRAANPNFRVPLSAKYIAIALAICVPLFIYRHQFELWEEADKIFYAEFGGTRVDLFDARNLGIARIINTAGVAYLFYALAHWRPAWFRIQFMSDMGAAALRVFCWHILVCYAMMPLRPTLAEQSAAVQLAVWTAAIASLYLPILAEKMIRKMRD